MRRVLKLLNRTLFKQLIGGFGLSLAIGGVVTLWMNYGLVQSDLNRQVERRAQSITQGLQFATEGLIEVGYDSMLDRVVSNYASLPDVVEVAIVDPEGMVLSHNRIIAINQPYQSVRPDLGDLVARAAQTGQMLNQRLVLGEESVLVEVLPFNSLLFGATTERGVAIAIINLQEMHQQARQTLLKSMAVFMLAIAGVLLIGGLLLRKNVIAPLLALNQAVESSQQTGNFQLYERLPANEIRYLARSFERVFHQLATYEQLEQEIEHRRQAEAALRTSERNEREKSQQLEQAIEELRDAQIQLIQTVKMSGLGNMVAGIAHEINNPVTFIKCNLSYVQRYVQELLTLVNLYSNANPTPDAAIEHYRQEIELDFIEEDLEQILRSMRTGTERIAAIVVSLRNFSRLDEAERKAVDIHEGIDNALMLLQHRLQDPDQGRMTEIIKHYDCLPRVECYAGLLNQVFLNILENAVDAVDACCDRASQIEIQTRMLERDRVQIQICDNGDGIPQAVQGKLFDPFFTTKPVGQGTGLGLSMSYKIVVEKHHGQLHCQSQLGQGTTFAIEIPTSLGTKI